MTDLFRGMTGLLSSTFGKQVAFIPQSGTFRQIGSIFRETPIEVPGADGQDVLIDAPSWRVAKDLAPEVRRGDQIQLPDGRRFKVQVVHSNGSPSPDAFVICELQAMEG